MSPAAQRQSGGFNLGDYVEVKERIKLFLEQFPEGRLVTGEVRLSSDPDGKPRVIVEAAAYRTPDDPLPGRGWSWMELPGTTSYTRGSELENTETSAWGRAIASLGIGIAKSIASKQEVDAKSAPEPAAQPFGVNPFDPLIGTAEQGKGDADFELRETPTGYRLAFRLVQGRHGIKVIATDILAQLIAGERDAIEGQTVSCWGTITPETFTPKGKSSPVTYQVLTLNRLTAGSVDLTEPDEEPKADEDFDSGWLDKVEPSAVA